jgi:ubiquinol-cytochrome c reductase cytochrome b subunit
MKSNKKTWIDERLQLDFLREKILYKPLSEDIGWWCTLGAVCLFLLILQVATGLVLALNYVPVIDRAFSSVEYIQNEMSFGWLIRGMHFWGSNMMLVAVFVHMMRVYFHAGYKKPNELTWVAGVFLIIFTAAMALTGYILPWSDISYWAATILSRCFDYIPVFGSLIANILGGKDPGGIAIGRYAVLHMLVIPAMFAGFTIIHIILIQIHGEKGPPPKEGKETGTRPFYPDQLSKDVVVVLIAFVMLIILARFAGVPKEKAAAPLAEINSVPKPEWFILFGYELLKMFKGKWIILAITAVPISGFLLLLFLPFYDRNPERAYAKRPIAMATGVSALLVLIYLTLVAHVSSPIPGRYFAPDRPLKIKELAGMALFEKNVCSSCHSITGIGMKNAPDLWKVGTKRDKEYLIKLLKDPDSVLGKGKMVKYYMDDIDLEALADYLRSLDFMHYHSKMIEPSEFRNAYKKYRSDFQGAIQE